MPEFRELKVPLQVQTRAVIRKYGVEIGHTEPVHDKYAQVKPQFHKDFLKKLGNYATEEDELTEKTMRKALEHSKKSKLIGGMDAGHADWDNRQLDFGFIVSEETLQKVGLENETTEKIQRIITHYLQSEMEKHFKGPDKIW